ncbi:MULTISPECIES: right-handed parallel beta-helix repeat-containing protein [unclassified Rhizobium]|uniref:M10 family metallopeptidase C-terminal domain-containing protein n=1 Tax=unclassified Rhizobium TaxID=2613769 RepID=UPI000BE95CB3|nr:MULTISPECIES: right-handed parallel beta-helix repeat-containing protein [unclassified Rhizobium]PDT07501.1 RTX toxin [Rhizobium sp. M1]PDT35107.1 RTX toxin [Rhizobium sp. M10]
MTTYYVSTTSSGGNGSASSPFRTISEAMRADLKPGDEVVVKPGTYNESINFDKDGSAAGDITLRSEVPGAALIRPPAGSYTGISVNANYVTIDGFDIKGGNGDGIEGNNVHHVSILNNKVHDSGESGVQFNYSDFIRIEGNETYNNASSGWYSGISIYQNRNITGDTSTEGYRTIVRDNISHDNVTKTGAHTDGNGIIIDDFQSTQTSGHPNYTFKTLVENNLVYENGGKGIQVAWSDSVTVQNNTAYHNNQDPLNDGTWRGELSNAQSSNNTWVNNIAVADPSVNSNNTAIDNTSYGGYTNQNTVWANNITFNGTAGQASVRTDGGNATPSAANGNKLGIDPHFVNAANGDFHLASGSAAIDSGTIKYGVDSADLDGDARVVGTIDMGAYESGSAPVSGTPTTPTQPAAPTTPTEPTAPTTPTEPTAPTTPTAPTAPTAPTQPTTPTTSTKVYTGTDGNDYLPHTGQSNGGNETFKGLSGNDVLKGGAGSDVLIGGAGRDFMSGGTSSDTFAFKTATETGSGWARDIITDFQHGTDKIDVSAIDANGSAQGDATFHFQAQENALFDKKAGALAWHYQDDATVIQADLNGDGVHDFEIQLKGHVQLGAGDFLL